MYHEQTFGGGMKQDIDPHLQPEGTYRYARNGRLLLNPDKADVTSGKAMSFTNVRGNQLALALPLGYTFIGSVESRKGTILFSTNGVDSEIGIWYYDTVSGPNIIFGAYRMLYNDKYDPHIKNQPYRVRSQNESGQDRLGWYTGDTIDATVYYENELTERLYWTNRRGTTHTLNLFDAPTNPVPTVGYYPKYWSVHAFRSQSDLVFPMMKLLGRGKGRLLSGAYQICVQYRARNGQRSVWSNVSGRRVFVTANPLDAYNANGTVNGTLQTAIRANHHNRTMSASGKMTGESLRWELKNLDVRWDEVCVAVLYFETEGLPRSITALKPITIGTQTSITVDITQVEGEELSAADLNERHETILGVGTLEVDQNRLFEFNLTMLKPIQLDTSAVTFVPKLQPMYADRTLGEPIFNSVANPVTKRNDGDPITNSPVGSGSISRTLFGNVSETYTYTDDYANYKGQVWDWLYSGYFRGETYEFGALVRDRQGNPLYVSPMPAFTFPEQYAPGPAGESDFYTLSKLDPATGLYYLNLMGVTISGLRLPTEGLYDDDNRLNISSIEIVRRKRKPTILHQGIIVPGCFGPNCKGDQDQEDSVWPLPAASNYFLRNAGGKPDSFLGQFGYYCWNGGGLLSGANRPYPTFTKPYFGFYHSPDVLIEESIRAVQAGDVLHNIGVARAAYNTSPKGKELAGFTRHFYNKAVQTITSGLPFADLAKNGRPVLGEQTRLAFTLLHNLGFNHTYTEFDNDDQNQLFETQSHVYLDSNFQDYPYTDGLLQRNALLVKMKDWVSVDLSESEQKPCAYRLVNYKQSVPQPFEDDTEPYYSTGYFLPVTQATLANAATVVGSNSQITHYVFNNMEVWGGDCYVNLFDFTRIYPYYSDGCEKRQDSWPDYSVSHIVPIESKWNIALRPGRTFAANATKPQATACEGQFNQFSNGIMAKQPEDWNMNKVLLLEEAVRFYYPLPRNTKIVSRRENGFQWTPKKVSGQLLDNWRKRYVGDYGEADGAYGAIMRVMKSNFQGLYCFQRHGFGIIPLEPMHLEATDAGTVVTNSGAVFPGMVYISRKYGTQHPDSVWSLKGQLGCWDARMGVLLRHSQAGLDELSNSENISDYVQALTVPLSAANEAAESLWDCVTGTDQENGEVLLTFSRNNVFLGTLVYSPVLSAFTGFYDVHAVRYASRGRMLISSNPASQNQLFAHNRGRYGEWYNQFYNTILRFIVNPSPTVNKTFDNGAVNVTEQGYNRIVRISHNPPNGRAAQTHILLPPTDDRFEWWDNVLAYPMHEMDWEDVKQRIRDHYLTVEIEVENDEQDVMVPITSFRTEYRITE